MQETSKPARIKAEPKNEISGKANKDKDFDARTCPQPCKICKGNQGIHPFYKCPEYRPFKPQTIQTLQQASNTTEHVLLEDDSLERDYCLEDLFAHEDTIDPHSRKRVRIEDIDDEDEVRFVSIPKVAEES